MTNQLFWYVKKEPIAVQVEGQETKYKEYRDGFSIDKIIRVITLDDTRTLVLLNDIHNRQQEVPVTNKQGKVTAYKRETITVQSEIYLEKEDADRLYKLTNDEK
jgi:hypothetical protein